MVTDPIADQIIRIKNAQIAFKDKVLIPYSKLKFQVALILAREGFVQSVEKKAKKTEKFIEIVLKYQDNRRPAIIDVKRISKPGRRMYMGYKDIRSSKQGFGRFIISTSKGIMTDKEVRKNKLGGEVLFEIW